MQKIVFIFFRKFVDKVEEFRLAPPTEVEKTELREAYQSNLEKVMS